MEQVKCGKGAMKRAAQEQARATREAADKEAARSRLAAQATQMQIEGNIARQRAGDKARDLQSAQIEQQVVVEQAPVTDLVTEENGTRKRLAKRDAYRTSQRTSGIQI